MVEDKSNVARYYLETCGRYFLVEHPKVLTAKDVEWIRSVAKVIDSNLERFVIKDSDILAYDI